MFVGPANMAPTPQEMVAWRDQAGQSNHLTSWQPRPERSLRRCRGFWAISPKGTGGFAATTFPSGQSGTWGKTRKGVRPRPHSPVGGWGEKEGDEGERS